MSRNIILLVNYCSGKQCACAAYGLNICPNIEPTTCFSKGARGLYRTTESDFVEHFAQKLVLQ